MLELVAPGHNDLLMVGMLAAGVAYALDGRPLLGIAVCALAATVKVPALAGALFIAVAWARAERDRCGQIRLALAAAGVTVAVLGVVTLITGVGVDWVSTSLFSTPARVHLAITPATAIGYTVASLLSDVGIAVSAHGLEHAFGVVGAAVTAVSGLVLLYRARISNLVVVLGAFLLIAAACGPAAWPWYFTWGLTLVAAVRRVQHSVVLPAAIALSVFLVKPNGILALPEGWAPVVLVVYIVIAVAAWTMWRRGRGGDAEARTGDACIAPAENRGRRQAAHLDTVH
jgi:alpha-1,6-mannosyltransferase